MAFFERLMPRNQDFFRPLADLAAKAAENAKLLREILADPAKGPVFLPGMHARRNELDEVSEEIDRRLLASFIAPIDPEDVAQLNTELHELGDAIDDTGRLVIAMRVDSRREPAVSLCSFLIDATAQLRDATAQLKNERIVHGATARIREIEHDADAVYHDAVSALFDGSSDPITVLKWNDVYTRVEDLIDMVHHAGNLLDRISFKRA